MSGHSKWATIKRAKEATDSRRSSIFSKLSKDIAIAAKIGQSGDLSFNSFLRIQVQKAKSSNMPNDKIEKAINKGLGISNEGEITFSKIYEAYTSLGMPFLIEVETDNPNRSLTEIKTIINKSGGKMVPEGSVSWQFKEIGVVNIKFLDINRDDVSLEIISIEGVEDIVFNNEDLNDRDCSIIVDKDRLREVIEGLKKMNQSIEIIDFSLMMINESKKDEDEVIEKNIDLFNKIKELEDVVNIWS